MLKLDKALYGLKQDPRPWYARLSKFVFANGFKRGKINNTLFLKSKGKNLLIFQVYVDDISFGVTLDSLCKDFVEWLSSNFEMSMMLEISEYEMSMMVELTFFLGLLIIQSLQAPPYVKKNTYRSRSRSSTC